MTQMKSRMMRRILLVSILANCSCSLLGYRSPEKLGLSECIHYDSALYDGDGCFYRYLDNPHVFLLRPDYQKESWDFLDYALFTLMLATAPAWQGADCMICDTENVRGLASEFVQSNYGLDAFMIHFSVHSQHESNEDHAKFYRFQVIPGDQLPPWDDWNALDAMPKKVGQVDVPIDLLE